jgi:replicative DNA helicase
MTEPKDYASILFTPEEIGVFGTQYLRQRRENKDLGVPLGLKILDTPDKDKNIFLPLMPGELMSIIARPGSGKTSFMVRWARHRAAYLKSKKLENRVVVYVTLEQTVEELNAFNVAADRRLSITDMARGEITDAEWKMCLEAGIDRRYDQVWNIGYSAFTEKKQIIIDVEAINGALTKIRDEHKKVIDIVFIDFLQNIPMRGGAESKTIGISDNLDAIKRMGLRTIKAPIVLGVQAKREVEERNPPVPQMDDGQWTSNIEQASDKIFSLVRPSKYREEGQEFGKTVVQGHCQMLISVLKQKLGASNFCRWVYFDPEYNKLDELEQGRQTR